ncbi:YjbQ family protein [Clostridium neonatale]|nr:YjbQ family protein [Clostridium neonatale]
MGRPSYHDIREELNKFVEESKIENGMLVVSSAHTTCSLYFDETMHDVNFYGDEYLQVDINNTMDRLVPKMTSENQYNSPGPKHIEFGLSLSDPNYPAEKWTMLNTDAHIRSSIYGSPSLTFIIKDGGLLLGALGRIYFVDWDQLRERKRTINMMILGE